MYNKRLLVIKKHTLVVLFVMGVFVGQNTAVGAGHPELKAFSPAKEGQQRFVIVLPPKDRDEEESLKVELIPGKVMLTDGVHRMRLGRTITAQPLKGWGYTYYEVTGKDIALSTMMAAPDGVEKKEEFVAGTSILAPYNSRLPLVIYGPEGIEVRFRIWRTSSGFEAVPEG